MNAQALWAILPTLRTRGSEPAVATLEIKSLHARVAEGDGEQILRGVDLKVKSGEIHALMGPNGPDKFATSKIIAGHLAYEITDDEILLRLGNDDLGDLGILDDARTWNLLELKPNEHATFGIFLSFRYPAEIEGVIVANFLHTVLNAKIDKRKELLFGEDVEEEEEEAGYDTSPMEGNVDDGEIGVAEFQELLKEEMDLLDMSEKFIQRYPNAGFSGGEEKQNEVLQAVILEPSITVLDEIGSGLDIGRLQDVSKGVNALRDEQGTGVLQIIHYQRILEYVEPDHVHIILGGKVVRNGDASLASELEDRGYDWVREKVCEAT